MSPHSLFISYKRKRNVNYTGKKQDSILIGRSELTAAGQMDILRLQM